MTTEHIWLMINSSANPEFERFFPEYVVLSKAYEPQRDMVSYILEISNYSESAYQAFRKETQWTHLLELCVPGVIDYPQWATGSKAQINLLLVRYGKSHLRRSDLEGFYIA